MIAADTTTIGGLDFSATDVTNIILVTTALIYGVILYFTRRSSQASTLMEVMKMVQSQAMRDDRRLLYQAATPDIREWSEELLSAAERVCAVYGTVGMLVRCRMVPRHRFMRNSGRTIARVYELSLPFQEQRSQDFVESGWPNLNWLYGLAVKRRFGFDMNEHTQWQAQRDIHVAKVRSSMNAKGI